MINAEAKCVDNALILCDGFNKQIKLINRCSIDRSPLPTIRSSYINIGNFKLIPPEGMIFNFHVTSNTMVLDTCEDIDLGGLICLGQNEFKDVVLVVKVISI
jgi:hypothetical protein